MNVRLDGYASPTRLGIEAMHYLFFEIFCEHMRGTGRYHILTQERLQEPLAIGVERLVRLGCVHKQIAVNTDLQITPELLEAAITPRTGLCTLSLACKVTGVMHPIEELAAVCRKKQVPFHVDATYGFVDIDVEYITCQHGLITKAPLHSRDFSSYAGQPIHVEDTMEYAYLRARFEKGVLASFPGAFALFQEVDRLPRYSVICFPGVSSRALIYLLGKKGIYALRAKDALHGYEPFFAECAVSFILPPGISVSDIDRLVDIVGSCAHTLRNYSVGVV